MSEGLLQGLALAPVFGVMVLQALTRLCVPHSEALREVWK